MSELARLIPTLDLYKLSCDKRVGSFRLFNLRTIQQKPAVVQQQDEWNRTDYAYQTYFCEENIWQLADRISKSDSAACRSVDLRASFVVFLTNQARQVAVASQKSAPVDGFTVWDYHVILLARIRIGSSPADTQSPESWYVFDFDTRMNFPEPAKNYLIRSFTELPTPPSVVPPAPWFRLVPVTTYLRRFDSDRDHMLDRGGNPLAPFPEWPAIRSDDPIELEKMWDSEQVIDGTELVNLSGMMRLAG